MQRALAVIGAPSSAGAYAPGQEQAPAALRAAGLIGLLREAGVEVADRGDVDGFRWVPDAGSPYAQNAGEVVRVARAVAAQVSAALDEGHRPLVLGGDCTVGVGTVLGLAARSERPGLVYLDLHADMNTPRSVVDGALDWMGLGHMLALPDTVDELVHIGGRAPLLDARRVVLAGFGNGTDWEHEQIAALGIGMVGDAELARDPAGAAARALEQLPGDCDRLALHFDVDLVDFTNAPLSENTGRNVGVPLASALEALRALAAAPRVDAITLTELNPLHGAEDGSTLRRFAGGFARALAGA